MPRFAANVSTMFPDRPVAERFAAARAAGFDAVEYLFPYAESTEEIAPRLRDAGIRMILVNTPLGDAASGERGLAAVPGREADFRAHFDKALCYARALDVPMIHVMAGVVAEAQRAEAEAVFVDNVRHAADLAANHDIRVLLEPLNHEDTPGYYLTLTAETRRLIEIVGRDNVRLQYDLYHRQIMEEIWRADSRTTSISSGTSSSRACPGATNLSTGKSTWRTSSMSATVSATTAGSAASTVR